VTGGSVTSGSVTSGTVTLTSTTDGSAACVDGAAAAEDGAETAAAGGSPEAGTGWPGCSVSGVDTVVMLPADEGEGFRERCRSGPGETCGSLSAGPDAAESCGRCTTGVRDSPFGLSAEGEADPSPKRMIAP
jgi:hypothetical protein